MSTNQNNVLRIIAACIAGLLPGGCRESPSAPDRTSRPNILLISLCSVRPDHMSLYGYQRDTTPNFAALARDSIVFDAAVTQWPKTVPAFAAIMTAKYPHTTGIARSTPNQILADEHVTLAEVLKKAGYETAAYMPAPGLNKKTNLHQGFDVVEELYRSPRRFFLTTERALIWLKDRDADKPFFIWAHYNHAHHPYIGGGGPPNVFVGDRFYDASRQVAVYDDPKAELPFDVPKDHPWRMQIVRADIAGVHWNAILRERPSEFAFYIARYDAGILGGDVAAGKLLDGVRELGLLDDTIVVVVGDHGESLGEHNLYMEHGRFPYDAASRVPLLIRPPGGTPTRRIDDPVATIRVAPTLLDMVGLEPPQDWEAESLRPLMAGQTEAAYVFSEAGYHFDYMLAVRDGEWKLIHVPNENDRALMTGSEYELYRWRKDPGETQNLYDEQPAAAARLRGILERWSQPWVARAYERVVAQPVKLDPETIQRLRALGYVGGNP